MQNYVFFTNWWVWSHLDGSQGFDHGPHEKIVNDITVNNH